MKTYYDLITDLERNLSALESSKEENVYSLSKKSIILCKEALEKLRAFENKKPFKNKEDEIEFFKYIKPTVLSYLIFYVKYLYIESKRPKQGKKEQVKYLKKFINTFQKYFNNNLEFYHYFKSKADHLDKQYFLKENKKIRLNIEAYHFFTDGQFSTSHDVTVATIMAYTNLIKYLKLEINKLETNDMSSTFKLHEKQKQLQWTNSKVELIELIYALYSCGAINRGDASIKEIALVLEEIFNIDLGNYYHSFVEMRLRKIKPTKFLDKLKEALIQYMKDLDEVKNK